jgi:hypothetical protein
VEILRKIGGEVQTSMMFKFSEARRDRIEGLIGDTYGMRNSNTETIQKMSDICEFKRRDSRSVRRKLGKVSTEGACEVLNSMPLIINHRPRYFVVKERKLLLSRFLVSEIQGLDIGSRDLV